MQKMKGLIFLIIVTICLSANYSFSQEKDAVNKFRPIGLKNDQVFVNYFKKFKLLVKNEDKIGLAKLMDNSYFTLHLTLDKKNGKNYETKNIRIKNRKDFIKYYSRIFNARMKIVIEHKNIDDLHINYMGVRLHRGQFWWYYDEKNNSIRTLSIANCNYIFP